MASIAVSAAFIAAGCCRPAMPAAANAANAAPASRPALPGAITFRAAAPKDLQLFITSWKPGANGFPRLLLELYNTTDDDLVVDLPPKSLVIHCGPYVIYGPDVTFNTRRIILDAHATLQMQPAKGAWTELGPDGRPQLMMPTTLPSAEYAMWATFGGDYTLVESERQTYKPD